MMFDIAVMFICYGFIGWLWETPYVSMKVGKFVNRGFLRGPFIPIYGFAATTIMLVIDGYVSLIGIKEWHHYLGAILIVSTIASIWEYVTSFVMEKAFSTRWWDYSDRKFNLNGRIALLPSLFWGVGGFILWRFVNPNLITGFGYVFNGYKIWILSGLYGLLWIDVMTTFYDLVHLRNFTNKLQTLSENFIDQIPSLKEVKKDMKSFVSYVRVDGLKDIWEFSNVIKKKTKAFVNEQEKSFEEWTQLLSKIKRVERFYKKYPNAITNKLPYIYYVIKKKREDKEK